MEEAQALLTEFRGAVARGDANAVVGLFSPISSTQQGFWDSLHIAIGKTGTLAEFGDFVQDHDPLLARVEVRGEHAVVHFEWVPRPRDDGTEERSPMAMRYYVVEEGGQLRLINPVDVLTRDWSSYEGDVCRFHFPPTAVSEEHIAAMERMDSLCLDLVRMFAAPEDFEVDVFVTLGAVQCGELILHPPAGGYACLPRGIIVSEVFLNPHELVHILATRGENELFINAAFAEGLSVALGGTYFCRPEFAVAQAKNIVESDMFIPLRDLMFYDDETFLENGQVSYQLAGSFVKFLIDRHGLQPLMKVYDRVREGGELRSCLVATLGKTVEELEADWLEEQKSGSIPTVEEYRIPAGARRVARFADPPGDDHGGGDYSYPTDARFAEGSLDITALEVWSDDANVYFRCEFRELGDAVLDEASGHTTVPGVTIALRRGDDAGRHHQKEYSGSRFADDVGFDMRIDVGTGVTVYDAHGQAVLVTGSIRESMSDDSGNTLSFSLPVEVVGTPDGRWRYFAASSLFTDFGFGFLRSFPCPVQAQIAEFRVGGADVAYASPFVDVILPDGVRQEDTFGNYDPRRGVPLAVWMLTATD